MYLLDYFTQGNIPDSLIGVPENWTPDQIASYQKYWDAYFDGDLGRRRRAKFVPGGVAKTFIQTKEPDLKGPFDEWLARIVCFAFSRGWTSELIEDAIKSGRHQDTLLLSMTRSAYGPSKRSLRISSRKLRRISSAFWLSSELFEIVSTLPSIDPQAQAQEAIVSSCTSKGIITINEARVVLGRDPYPDGRQLRGKELSWVYDRYSSHSWGTYAGDRNRSA